MLHTPMGRVRRRTRLAATATSAALVAGVGGLVLAAAPAANAADQSIDKNFAYTCATVAAGLDLGNKAVNVNAKVVLPDAVTAGTTIPTRKTTITLTLPEDLRLATYGLLSARKVDGYSNNAAVNLKDSGSYNQNVLIANLKAKDVVVPPGVGDPWVVPTVGDVPAIALPANVGGTATVSMPAAFTVKATLYNEAGGLVGGTDAVTMACTLNAGVVSTLATMPISAAPKISATLTGSAGAITYGRTGAITARLSSAVGGRVDAYIGTRRIGAAAVRGTTAVIPVGGTALRPGAYAVTLRHSGGPVNLNPVAARAIRVTVVKARSALAAKVSPSKVKAKKTAAKVLVTVSTTGFKATGTVTAKIGSKTVGKGTVSGGRATVKLKKFKKKGTYTVKLTYSGNAYAGGSTKTVKVKVKK